EALTMVFEIRYSRFADDNLKDILSYLSESWSNEVVFGFANRLSARLERIKTHPHHFPFHDEKRTVRKCSLNPYHGIFYKIDGNIIYIVAIFDLRQDPQKLKSIL
ncbi:MAG: type II toxin-antitoxin system RelE/ParE family toxin, partial [Chitinophagales bacterium]